MPKLVVVIGVSASGKTTLGKALAVQLDTAFVEGDDLHPAANVEKIRLGVPLDDEDRGPWLDKVAEWMTERARSGQRGVVACSALKRGYRDRLRDAVPDAVFLLLSPPEATLRHRIAARKGHFMPPSLLTSQLRTLEKPGPSEHALTIEGDLDLGEACLQALTWLHAGDAVHAEHFAHRRRAAAQSRPKPISKKVKPATTSLPRPAPARSRATPGRKAPRAK